MAIRKRHIFGGALAFFLLALAAAFLAVPWMDVLHGRMLSILKSKGIEHIDFKISGVTLHGIELSDIVIGKDNPLLLDRAAVKFAPKELIDGNVQDVTLSGLTVGITQGADGWTVTGLDVLPARSGEKTPPDVPQILSALPFRSLAIEDSRLILSGKSVNGTLPFRLEIGDRVSFETTQAEIVVAGAPRDIGPLAVRLAPEDDKSWAGTWTTGALSFGEGVPVPVMSGAGKISLKGAVIAADGKFADTAKTTTASIKGAIDLGDPAKTGATLASASFPFKGGRISTQNVPLALPARVAVKVERVSVDELMQSMTGKKVSATGTLSGSIPVKIARDGSYTFGEGGLTANGDGRISMPETLIPGENQHVALVRDILKDLRYTLLSARLKPGADGRPGVSLSLEGRNPAVYDGREVKLNINLTGDVLDFVRQNLELFQSPEKFLERELEK